MRVRRLTLMVASLLTLLAAGPRPALADTATDLTTAQQQQQLLKQVQAQLTSNLADALQAQIQLEQSLKDNAQQQEATRQSIDEANEKIADLDLKIAAGQRQIDATNRRIDVEKQQIGSLAKAIYVQPQSVLVMLGEAHSLSDLITRIADLASAGQRASALKSNLNDDYAKLSVQQAQLRTAHEQQVAARQALQDDLAKLVDLQQKQEKSAQDLAASMARTRYELAIVTGQNADLAKQIADLLQQQQNEIIAAAMQAVWDQVKLWEDSHSIGPIPASAGHSTKYRFIWPEPAAQISQGYGPTPYAFEPSYNGYAHFHTGIDLVEPVNSPILAADDGVVVKVDSDKYGYGNYVVIEHANGLNTLYGHLNKANVKVGDIVTQGTVVGIEGSTGNSTGPHVHFELRINGKPVDPSPYLPPGPPSPFKA